MRNSTFNCTLSTKKPVKALRYYSDSVLQEALRPKGHLSPGARGWEPGTGAIQTGRNLWRLGETSGGHRPNLQPEAGALKVSQGFVQPSSEHLPYREKPSLALL